MIPPWMTDKEKFEEDRPFLQIPLYEEEKKEELEEKSETESNRGVIIINLFDEEEE